MTAPTVPSPTGAPDAATLLRSRGYLTMLVLAALLGAPISALAYGFLALVAVIQGFVFEDLPAELFGSAPAWWPMPWLALCGLLTALTITYLPGTGGHSPALGFSTGGGPPAGRDLFGIALAGDGDTKDCLEAVTHEAGDPATVLYNRHGQAL